MTESTENTAAVAKLLDTVSTHVSSAELIVQLQDELKREREKVDSWRNLCNAADEEYNVVVRERDAAVDELSAVKRELTDAALWNDDSGETTTPSVQVYVLHQKLIERADDCRVWDRRYEAAIKTLGIITQHRNELAALCERQAQQLAAQQVPVAQATAQKQPMPKPRIPVRPLPHNSGGKFDAKRSMEILSETVEDLVSAVNDLQRWACE